jgi:hypothetical protein
MTLSHLGDFGEVLAFACVAAFVAIYFAPVWALLVAAVGLFYLAQDWTEITLPKPKLRKPHLPELRVRHLRDAKGS